MSLLTYEDFTPGETISYGHYPVTREAIMEFAREFDPQPFHLDAAVAEKSLLGGLSASGWHSAGMLMRMSCDDWVNRSDSWGGPGIKALKWLKPVRPGDVLSARRTLQSKRLSQSRPEMGLLDFHFELLNQHSEVVMMQDNIVMIGLRGKSPPPVLVAPRAPILPAAPIAPPMLSGWYEDSVPGGKIVLGDYTFERDDIVRFAAKFDPQPFHLNEAAAAKSHFGALAASGWQTSAAWMRLMVAARQRYDAAQAAPPESGPSPGFTDLRWLKPVYVGDRLTYSMAVVARRATSRPGWGLVTTLNSAVNQWGERVIEFTASVFSKMRG